MPKLVFLIDVDNTLIDNDRVKEDFDAHLQVELGPELTRRFWEIYEEVRKEEGVVDIPRSLQRLRQETPPAELDELTFAHVASIFNNYPFYKALYPHALETLQYLGTLGLTVIVSDGDLFFQAEKIFNSSLAEAVDGRVLLYDHKQEHMEEVMRKYPGDHYAIIDDKPQILVDVKAKWPQLMITVFVEQGKYAATEQPPDFRPDLRVLHIADLRNFSGADFLQADKSGEVG
jgi:FMN phosphatase YigB (HAD superfamily)